MEPIIYIDLIIEEPILLDLVPEPALHILPKGRELTIIRQEVTDSTNLLLIYQIAKL